MCANWGYEKLHKSFEKRAIEEMKHAEQSSPEFSSLKAYRLFRSSENYRLVHPFPNSSNMIMTTK